MKPSLPASHRRPCSGRRRQRGAVAVLVGFSMVALILVLGLVLDLGHLYVAKSELQNAADACALSAARELNDRSPGVYQRAVAAARTAGQRNWTDLQRRRAEVRIADVTFSEQRDSGFGDQITAATVYVRCAPRDSDPASVVLWFMRIAGASEWAVRAEATARLVPSQSFCAMPLAACTKDPAAPNFGFDEGRWYKGRMGAGTALTGNYGWIRFSGQGASDLGEMIAGSGKCDLRAGELVDAEAGVSTGVVLAWNTRFGLYSGSYNDLNRYPPDRTGFAYTPNLLDKDGNPIAGSGSWPYPAAPSSAPQNAYSGAGPPANYLFQKNDPNGHAPFDPSQLLDANLKPAKLPGNPSPLSRELHASKGQDRRLVLMPVIRCESWAPNKKNIEILGYACNLLLSPIADADTDVQYEFRALMGAGPCASSGIPGGSGAPVTALSR